MHMIYVMYEHALSKVESQKIQCANLKKLFNTVLANFALNQLLIDHSALFDCGFFSRGSSDLLS